MSEKYRNGAFVFYRVSSEYQPMTPLEIEALVAQQAMPASVVPEYAGDRTAVLRAISASTSSARKAGWVLTSIKSSPKEVVYGISALKKDRLLERVEHTFDDRFRWNDETQASRIVGTHPVAEQVNANYQELRGKIVASDWTELLTTYLRDECNAQMILASGYVYWCPPAALPQLQALLEFLDKVHVSLVICEVESERRVVVQQAAQEGLAEQLQKLQEEADAFDSTQMPSTYRSRIEAYQGLRKRATLYRDTLGIGIEQACTVLDTLETKIQAMLTTRESTVVHRNGTTAPVAKGNQAARKRLWDLVEQSAQQDPALAAVLTETPPALPVQW